MQLRRFVALFAVIVAVVITFSVLVVHAQSYKVKFLNESLTVTPPRQGHGMRVTFTFNVQNDGATMKRVQIRVLQPCNSRGEGRVLADVPSQTIGRGTTTYNVSGIFEAPTGDKNFVLIQLLDKGSSTNPPPVITHSGVRKIEAVTFRVVPYRPAS